MKLQYLGDARDAFKWDILHWICTKSTPPFFNLVFIPMLTPDGGNPNEGNIHHSRFECRDFIRPFLESLRQEPRSLDCIGKLGYAESKPPQFQTTIFSNDSIEQGNQRKDYWQNFHPEEHENAVIFFDPDNGFETKTQKGTKWIRHEELNQCLSKLPETSVIVVYQHRPRRTWADLFTDIKDNLHYAHAVIAAYESDIAFVAIAGNESAGNRIKDAINGYASNHLDVCSKKII